MKSYDVWKTISPGLEANTSRIAWIRRVRKGEPLSYTYQQIHQGALHTAARLQRHGVEQGDTISVIGPNGPEWGIGALALWRVGAVLAPVHIGNSDDDIRKQLDALNPKLILAHDADSKLKDVNYEILQLEIDSELADEGAALPEHDFRDEEAVKIYTSGSTGSPKVVRLSHENISSNFVACSKIVKIDHNDRFLNLLPLSHTFELVGGMMLPLYCGASIVVPKVLTAQEVLAAMLEEKVSVVLAVPRLFRSIKEGMENKFRDGSFLLRGYVKLLGALPLGMRCVLNAPLRKKLSPNLRYWVSGGSRLDPTIMQFFQRLGISLRQGYGLTETSPVVCVQEAFPAHFDSVGYPIEGVELMINEPDDQGCGEVLVKGHNVMLGYSDPEMTREVMEGEWFRTGDVGRLDAFGNLSLTGRIKRTISTESGKNVFPEELETLIERFDGVKEAGIIDVEMRPVVVLAMDNPESSGAAAKQILKTFNSNASPHNQITRCAVVEELPRTPLGKTALTKLGDIFAEHEVR